MVDLPDHHVDLPVTRESMERMDLGVAAMAADPYSPADARRLHVESRKLRSRKHRPERGPADESEGENGVLDLD